MTFSIPFLQNQSLCLILQIDPSGAFFALATMKRGALLLHAIQYTPCTEHEITAMSIANPTEIAQRARLFLDQQGKLKLPIICFSSLLNAMTSPPQQVLQHLLCLSKIGGPVIGLYKGTPIANTETAGHAIAFIQAELSNLIDIISTPTIKSWQQRITTCAAIIIMPLLSGIGYKCYQIRCLKNSSHQEKQLNNYLNQLKPRVQATKALEQENNILKDRINTIKNLTEEHEISAHICQAIATHIPDNTWLTTITVGQKPFGATNNTKQAAQQQAETLLKEMPPKSIPLHIEGKTTSPDEISIFLEKLTTALPNSTLSIEHIGRNPQEKLHKGPRSTNPYNFILTGLLKRGE